jgi:hypothetical protein
VFWENAYHVDPATELLVRFQKKQTERMREDAAGMRRQGWEDVQRYRYQITWTASRAFQLRLRHETRFEEVHSSGEKAAGRLLMGEIQARPFEDLVLKARLYFFDSPQAFLTAGAEEIWDNVYYDRLAGGLGNFRGTPGTRFAWMMKQTFGPGLQLWLKYDVNHRPSDLTTPPASPSKQEDQVFTAIRQGFHLQMDYRWGN